MGGLNMSRALGDLLGHQDAGIIATPTVTEYQLQPEDAALLLCSDGVWEFVNVQEAADIVFSVGPEKPDMAVQKLAKESWDRWITEEGGAVVDDITALVVFLKQQ